jgi:transcription antitermination factor NusG
MIPDSQIADVRRVLTAAPAAAECPHVAGQAVTVRSGPLAGVRGVIERCSATRSSGKTRLIVGIEAMGRALSVEIDAAALEA